MWVATQGQSDRLANSALIAAALCFGDPWVTESL